jgi:uncharacterized protein with PIN domain
MPNDTTADSTVELRFYEELSDFLPPQRRGRSFTYPLTRRTSVKDLIEALGVPHTEVDLILAGGESVGFDHPVQAGERIAVYPLFESLDIADLTQVRPTPLRAGRPPCFVCDVHLGTLARYLRLAGFDTVWRNDLHDAELADISAREQRVLLTRDRGLLQRRIVTHGVFIRADEPRQQFAQVFRRLDLRALVQPFGRCPRCNGPLHPVAKAAIAHRLEPKTRRYYDHFWQCGGCGQIYWKGSHYDPICRLLTVLTADGGPAKVQSGPQASV